MNKLGKVVGRLSRLETIRMDWSPKWARVKPETVEDLMCIIRRNGNRIKSLELPYLKVKPLVLKSLPNITTFVGSLSTSDSLSTPTSNQPKAIFNSQCRLQRLVFNFPFTQSSFITMIKPFRSTLTSLAIVMDPDSGPLDLSTFEHLTILRLVISDVRNLIAFTHPNFLVLASITDTSLLSTNFIQQIRQTLESVQNLPSLRSLTLAATRIAIAESLSSSSLFDLLPRTLESLITSPQMLRVENQRGEGEGGEQKVSNGSILLDSLESNQLPHLTSIALLPSSLVPKVQEGGGREQTLMIRREFENLCQTRNLGIEVEEIKIPKYLNRGIALDPARVEYEVDDHGQEQDRRDEREMERSNEEEEELVDVEEEKKETKPPLWTRLKSSIRRLLRKIC